MEIGFTFIKKFIIIKKVTLQMMQKEQKKIINGLFELMRERKKMKERRME